MPKRKLSDLNNPGPGTAQAAKASLLTQTFEQGVHNISRALRTARGFERQKLGRREQKARSEGNREVLERVGGEIAALKGLEYTSTAEKYLFKQLVKTKRIAESQAFDEFRQTRNISTAGPGSPAEANITARLFKAKPVQNVIPGIMGGVRKILELEDGGSKPGKGGGVTEPKKEKKNQTALPDREDGRNAPSKSRENPNAGNEDEKEEEEWEGISSADADSVYYTQFDSRLTSDSNSDSDEDPPPAGAQGADSDSEHDISVPSNRITPILRSPSPPPKKSKTTTKTTTAPPTSTTFLPSLAMGGYFSGSESEPSDIEEGGSGGGPRRKNRMGQQARRALWEKKYGTGANHVKKQKKDEKRGRNRDSGWDLKRGATDPEGDRRERFMKKKRYEKEGGRTAAMPKKTQDDKPLHPSWEAKRKSKEQKPTAAFEGKKVVFD